MKRTAGKENDTLGTIPRGVPRVSLLTGTTGMPLMILYLQELSKPFHRELGSLEQVEVLKLQAGSPSDQRAWGMVEAFFKAGGTRAHIVALPQPAAKKRLQNMIGSDKGIDRRTGIQLVKNWAEKADLLVIPQATELLNTGDYFGFVQAVCDLTCPSLGIFYLADLPKAFSVEESEAFSKNLFCPDAAIYHPWVLDGTLSVPPSVAIAAWVQRGDAEMGVQEIPQEIALGGGLTPLSEVTPRSRSRLLAARINTFLVHAGHTRVWGGYTLADSANFRARLIPLRRTTIKLRQATEQVCEPYVLEAAGDELPVQVENSLQNFLRSVRRLFHKDATIPFSTSVELVEHEKEQRLQVGLSYSLPHSLEKFSLSFVA